MVEIHAPAIANHSILLSFSLNINTDDNADKTITPPEIIGNCTDAGTLSAAIKIKKLPV